MKSIGRMETHLKIIKTITKKKIKVRKINHIEYNI